MPEAGLVEVEIAEDGERRLDGSESARGRGRGGGGVSEMGSGKGNVEVETVGREGES